jgi:dTDP-glucose 4,6-dehydratase
MENVLVTGGAGFIGSAFIRHLLADDPELKVVNLDALTYAGSLRNLGDLPDPERHRLVQGDICDRELVDSLFRDCDIDTVAHFAAETHVDRSILGPAAFVQTNVVGTYSLLESARLAWCGPSEKAGRLFLHISTDEVYGPLGPTDQAFTEDAPYSPRSPYAATKAASDHLVRSYAHTYGLPAIITNCSNNYGPRQHPEKLIPLIILNASEGKHLPVYGDGMQIRDWLFVEDHCKALELVIRGGRHGETYNLGGGNQHTNLEVVEQLCAILDDLRPGPPWAPHQSLVRLVSDRPGHDRRYAIDTSKIESELGWQPKHTLSEGLRETVEWYLENVAWVEAIRAEPAYQAWMQSNYATRG